MEWLSENWLWLVAIGGMLWMHLGMHRGHGGSHGGHDHGPDRPPAAHDHEATADGSGAGTERGRHHSAGPTRHST